MGSVGWGQRKSCVFWINVKIIYMVLWGKSWESWFLASHMWEYRIFQEWEVIKGYSWWDVRTVLGGGNRRVLIYIMFQYAQQSIWITWIRISKSWMMPFGPMNSKVSPLRLRALGRPLSRSPTAAEAADWKPTKATEGDLGRSLWQFRWQSGCCDRWENHGISRFFSGYMV
jgi:hypothetical protein